MHEDEKTRGKKATAAGEEIKTIAEFHQWAQNFSSELVRAEKGMVETVSEGEEKSYGEADPQISPSVHAPGGWHSA